MKAEPSDDSESISELLYGESVQIHESVDGWCKIESVHDGYKGYIHSDVLDLTEMIATHWVCNKATLVFEQADIKSAVIDRFTFGSVLCAESSGEHFLRLQSGGYVWADHCFALGKLLSESMVEIGRQQYLHAPYRWGGRSTDGCDCSGLVQMLAKAVGIELPRDSIDQQQSLKVDIEYQHRQAEDLVFWPGHIGILESPDLLLHSTAHSMRCCFEPLAQVNDRAGMPVAIKRIV